MDRTFDYDQRILLAIEIADAPRQLKGMPATYARFKRLSIADVVRVFDETQNLFVQLIAGRKFRSVLEQHMGYWEKRIPDGKQCFVHYAIGSRDVISAAFNRLSRNRRPTLSAFRSATRRIIGTSASISR
jgi:hypothetical protein